MGSTLRGWLRVLSVGTGILALGTGCTESFTATGGSAGTTGSGGATGGTGGATGGAGGTTTNPKPDCTQGETETCYEGPMGTEGVGNCKAGVHKCVSGKWSKACFGQVTPAATELCNGQDDNCNGNTDEGCTCSDGDTQDCTAGSGTPGVGICKSGKQTCSGGAWGACMGAVGAGTETCANPGFDDDCNGVKDDVPNAGTTCDTGGIGVCAVGTRHCVGDQLKCMQNVQPMAETCANPGADDNCNGVPDDVPNLGQTCQVLLPQGGMCNGVQKCGNGSVTPFCGAAVFFADDFSGGNGWDVGNEWQIGPAMMSNTQTAGNGDPADDHSPSPDKKIAGVVIGGNADSQVHEPHYLVSKVFDTNKALPVFLTFFRWLNTNPVDQMKSTVDVSTDGGNNWSNIWTNTDGSLFDATWTPISYDVSAYKSQQFRVRFGVEVVANGGPTVSGWNIDDFALQSCPLAP